MIYYLVRAAHRTTVTQWLDAHPAWRSRLVVLPYERLGGWLAPGAFVFSDVDRLTPWLRRNAVTAHESALQAGCPVLNDPQRSLLRYDIQQALDNDFRVFRANGSSTSGLEDVRFPVFLRDENEHGAMSRLIPDAQRLRRELKKRPGSLVTEFLDTGDDQGVYRKYGAMKVGEALFARHIFFQRRWKVRENQVLGDAWVEEERAYVKDFPHREQVARVFEIARIDYGRIDYAFHQGRMQVWEVNTNPALRTELREKDARRHLVLQLATAAHAEAFEALDARVPRHAPRVWCGPRWRTHVGTWVGL